MLGDAVAHLVSIPRSEFWSFGPLYSQPPTAALGRFQFLGRNSGRSDHGLAAVEVERWMFQFLGRNSGRSDETTIAQKYEGAGRFNSSVGILVVRTIGHLNHNLGHL